MVTTAAVIEHASTIPATFIVPTVGKGVNISRNTEVRQAVEEWKALKKVEAAGTAAKRKREALEKAVLRPALGDADHFIVMAQKVLTLGAPQENTHIDKARLLELSPELYDLTLVRTPYTVFKALV